MTEKFRSITATIGPNVAGTNMDIVNEKIDDMDRITGIAIFEAANANDIDYDLRVADKSNTIQDFTTKYDFLSIIKGVNIKNVSFKDYYKPYAMPGNGNRVKVGIFLNQVINAGQSVTLKVVIRGEKD